jgi:hypothetical protein
MNTTFISLKQQTIKANILINRLTHRETVAYVSSMHQKGCLSHPQWSHRREGHGCACHTLHQHIGAPTLHHQGGLADLPSRLCSCESLAHRKCHRPTQCILYPSSSCPAEFLENKLSETSRKTAHSCLHPLYEKIVLQSPLWGDVACIRGLQVMMACKP